MDKKKIVKYVGTGILTAALLSGIGINVYSNENSGLLHQLFDSKIEEDVVPEGYIKMGNVVINEDLLEAPEGFVRVGDKFVSENAPKIVAPEGFVRVGDKFVNEDAPKIVAPEGFTLVQTSNNEFVAVRNDINTINPIKVINEDGTISYTAPAGYTLKKVGDQYFAVKTVTTEISLNNISELQGLTYIGAYLNVFEGGSQQIFRFYDETNNIFIEYDENMLENLINNQQLSR